MTTRLVYSFGAGQADGGREMKALLGGKGANLAEMARIGVPVPPGFTLTTEVCRRYLAEGSYPAALSGEVEAALRRVEQATGREFGSASRPLLVSVRSGAAISMPGMMDTILNLGLNDETVTALATEAGDERFAFDSYRRFVQMYASVVLGVRAERFEELLEAKKHTLGVSEDTALSAEALRELVGEYKALVSESSGAEFPEDPHAQLWGAIDAVFRSWQTPRAVAYRRVHNIANDLGTAVNVVAMVFGNLGENSGTGVVFTRNPSTGERALFGEFLLNAQGEDVVAGIRTPLPIDEMEKVLPEAHKELVRVASLLEEHYREAEDVEFTVERGELYLLQTRTAKRTAAAAVRIATEMVAERLISREEALTRVPAGQLDQLLHPSLDPDAQVHLLTTGLPASPGAASGRVVFDADEAVRRAGEGEAVILVRRETSPEDFHGMVAAQAILTSRGGMTSHAAVVARGMGKCCVAGAQDVEVDEAAALFRVKGETVREGEWITLDGATGRVILGQVPRVEPQLSGAFQELMSWADEARRLGVRANADTPHDAEVARRFGAEGIGLCRTEHMFFATPSLSSDLFATPSLRGGESPTTPSPRETTNSQGERIDVMREMILAEDEAARAAALEKLLPMQREDFFGIFRAMAGLPVTVRLLDPPLHEFLPHDDAEIAELARNLGTDAARLRQRVEQHREQNPMLGLRGVRLGISYPEITRMQVRALLEAALSAQTEGIEVKPEIMVPLVSTAEELRRQRALIEEVAEQVFAEAGERVELLIGTMIELPRAALTADRIAEEAEFFSFGTNDLTQTTFGLSRDDAGRFLPAYIEAGILDADPFQTLDEAGVGRLVEMGTALGRSTRPELEVGVCGEHGGDPRSVAFFHRAGLDYVSCSPYRVPIARLAAAQAALAERAEPAPTPPTGADAAWVLAATR